MSQLGFEEYNPCGRDRTRFESQEDFYERCARDRHDAEQHEERERQRRAEECETVE
jgi:hypothetical protein